MEKAILFSELAELLTRENDVHQNLISVAQEINKCAKTNDVDGLKIKTSVYDEHLCNLERAEERRADICNRLKDILGDAVPSGRMMTIIEHSDPAQRDRLKGLRKTLVERAGQLKAINTSNIVIFKEALKGINTSVDIIKKTSTPKTGYRYNGGVKTNSNLQLFNQVV